MSVKEEIATHVCFLVGFCSRRSLCYSMADDIRRAQDVDHRCLTGVLATMQDVENRAVELSKARVCGRSLAGIVGSNPAGGIDVVNVVCCQVEFSASD